MFSKTSRKDVAKDKIAEAVSAVGDAAEAAVGDAAQVGREKVAPVVGTAADRLSDAADAVAPKAARAKKSARKAAKQAAKQAKSASDQAYAALPEQARSTVEVVVPQVARKRHTKGKLFIALGLLTGAAAVALLVRDKQHSGGGAVAVTQLPEVESRDAAAAEDTESVAVTGSDDAVGDAEQQVDEAVSGRKGRHAARE